MSDFTIPSDIVMSSLDSIENGIIIFDKDGKIAHVNEWIVKHSQHRREDILHSSIDALFGGVSTALISAIKLAQSAKLSRVLSHKMHKEILPLYVQTSAGQEPLNVSVLVTPLVKEGVLLRVIDYTALVKRESQIRFNEKLLTVEKDFMSRAPDLSETLNHYIQELVERLNRLPHPFTVQLGRLLNGQFQRFAAQQPPKVHKQVESIIVSKNTPEALADIAQLSDHAEYLYFPIQSVTESVIKGYVAFSSLQKSSMLLITNKNTSKIADLVNSLIEWKLNYVRLNYLANHDVLTGLLNRSSLVNEFNQAVSAFDAQTLLFIDLNKFKQINDQHGHHIGDKVLQKVASKINRVLTESDIAFRIGGDEFVILRKGPEETDTLADDLLDAISRSFLCDAIVISMSASIGRAKYPEDGQTLDDLLLMSDKAMYQHKHDAQQLTHTTRPR